MITVSKSKMKGEDGFSAVACGVKKDLLSGYWELITTHKQQHTTLAKKFI
jgi:hypothetical protein